MVEDFTPFFNMYVYIMQEQTIQQTFDVIASESTHHTDIRFPSKDYREKIGAIIDEINKTTTPSIDKGFDPNSRDYDIAKLILIMNKVMNWKYKDMIYKQQRRKYNKEVPYFYKSRPPIKPEFNEKDEFNNGELDEVKTEFIDTKENDDKKEKLDRFITKIVNAIYYYEHLALPNGYKASEGLNFLGYQGGTRRRRKGQRTRKRGTRKAKKTRRTIRTRRARKTKKR